jgi:hypothetical protein
MSADEQDADIDHTTTTRTIDRKNSHGFSDGCCAAFQRTGKRWQ